MGTAMVSGHAHLWVKSTLPGEPAASRCVRQPLCRVLKCHTQLDTLRTLPTRKVGGQRRVAALAFLPGMEWPPATPELRGREVLAASGALLWPGCLSLAEYFGVNIVLCTLN